jgi:hypothetical protein
MLEWIVHSRHLEELNRTIEVLGEPQLLEVRYVADIPDNRAHERVVLSMQVLIR